MDIFLCDLTWLPNHANHQSQYTSIYLRKHSVQVDHARQMRNFRIKIDNKGSSARHDIKKDQRLINAQAQLSELDSSLEIIVVQFKFIDLIVRH